MPTMKMESDLRRWKEILGWFKMPNFGNCHDIDDATEFDKHYALTEDLKKTVDNILLSLEDGGREQLNRIIVGRPGCGKTSFIHFLKRKSKSGHPLLSKFYFYIYDINRADTEYKVALASEMVKGWAGFFKASGRSDVASRIKIQRKSDREKCNLFESYYINNKKLFARVFIFILDETDTMDELMVKEISRELISIVSTKEVKKWLMIRSATLKQYSSETHDVFDSFFPNQTNFLGADVWDIIEHRVLRTSGGDSPKNPFSKKLAINVLSDVFGGNIRAALGSLESILKYSNVNNVENYTSEEFIQNFVEKSAFPALLRLSHIPNIFDARFAASRFPLAIDILQLAQYTKQIARIKRVLNEVSTERASQMGIIDARERKNILIPADEFDFAVDALVSSGLATKPTRAEFAISQMGRFVARNMFVESYLDACLEQNAEAGYTFGSKQLDLMVGRIDHQSFILYDYVQ